MILILGHHFPLCVFEAVSPGADHSTGWLLRVWVWAARTQPYGRWRGGREGGLLLRKPARKGDPSRQPVQTRVKHHEGQEGLWPGRRDQLSQSMAFLLAGPPPAPAACSVSGLGFLPVAAFGKQSLRLNAQKTGICTPPGHMKPDWPGRSRPLPSCLVPALLKWCSILQKLKLVFVLFPGPPKPTSCG